jgi:hypothetical protein
MLNIYVLILLELISVSKRARQRFDLERFDLKKLSDVEANKKFQTDVWNKYAALESLDEFGY